MHIIIINGPMGVGKTTVEKAEFTEYRHLWGML